jgi:hypothetical protein
MCWRARSHRGVFAREAKEGGPFILTVLHDVLHDDGTKASNLDNGSATDENLL